MHLLIFNFFSYDLIKQIYNSYVNLGQSLYCNIKFVYNNCNTVKKNFNKYI